MSKKMEYFDIAETWSRDKIEEIQVIRLRNTIQQASRSPFYAQRFAEAGITPESIKSVSDVASIPFTTKDDLRSNYPYGMICVPHAELVRLHSSSGTTGAPVAIHYTEGDIRHWADLMARCLYMVGIRREDVFQNMSGYGLFTGGLGLHYGAERLGCLTIPSGPGNTKRQTKIIRDFGTTAAHIIPSYALYFASVLEAEGEDPASLPLRVAVIGAEPHTDEVRRRVETLFNIKAYNSYGLTEMNGPGDAFECVEQHGAHVWEDAYIAEIVDPATGAVLPDGEVGELVMTTLCRRGMPVLRYRTRDLTRILTGDCPCGRAHRRLDRILGRADDMLIIKGVNIYPMQIEQILMSFPEVGQNYLIELFREGYIDQIRVKVELREEFFVEDMRVLQGIQKAISRALRDEILITPRVDLVQANSLPTSEGKAKRVVDLRD